MVFDSDHHDADATIRPASVSLLRSFLALFLVEGIKDFYGTFSLAIMCWPKRLNPLVPHPHPQRSASLGRK